jgi:hypothetical protein
MSYSQQDEERIILEHFGNRTGTFLDVGAADGVKFSNTRALYEHGWGGHLVEPNPREFVKLLDLYAHDARALLWNVALDLGSHVSPFWGSKDTVVATLDAKTLGTWKGSYDFRAWNLYTLDINEFLLYVPRIDFASVDAEGRSYALAAAIVVARNPEMLCVERDPDEGQFHKAMKFSGYDLVQSNAQNDIWVRRPA